MTGSVPFLFVNVIALCLYMIMIGTFAAAKKTPAIKAFLIMLVGFLFWTGGSVLMRLQVFPGVTFWFYVSIIGLFCLALLIYLFICSFVQSKAYLVKIIWTTLTALMCVATLAGFIISPPNVIMTLGGQPTYTYEFSWQLAIPIVILPLIILSAFFEFRQAIQKNGIRSPGIPEIIIGCAAILVGNVIVLIDGNIFPFDTLAGIIFALLLIVALYRRRMFQLTLLVSRGVLVMLSTLFCILVSVLFVGNLQENAQSRLGVSSNLATVIVITGLLIFFVIVNSLLSKLVDAIFSRGEQQGRLIKNFADNVSRTLISSEIMDSLISVILSEIDVNDIFIDRKSVV